MKQENKPDGDQGVDNSNNNSASVNVNNYFGNNKSSSSSLGPAEGELEEDDEEDLDDELESGSGVAEDYSDYEENIEEFATSSNQEEGGGVSVNNSTESPVNSSPAKEGFPVMSVEETSEPLPQQEQLIQPDQIRNVVDESATEILDETSDWPRTEALIGIRPYAQEEQEEGSGNGGRNKNIDDDDDYDDDDEETDIMKARRRVKNARENAERGNRRFNNYNGNLEEDSDEDGSSRYLKNRRFGKNNAIKFISTPHGKVGILYSSSSADDAKNTNSVSASSSGGAPSGDGKKDMFRGISSDLRPILISNPDSRSSEDRNSGSPSSSGGKMTPVLTADGKVALLYRGASAENENVAKKYEPIVNYTKPAASTAAPLPAAKESNLETDDDDDDEEDQDNVRGEQTTDREAKDHFAGRRFENDFSMRSNVAHHPFQPPPIGGQRQEKVHNSIGGGGDRDSGELQDTRMPAHMPPPPPRLEDNNFLPILDRPLSELLGLKKHQFTHFRVTEPAPTTAIPQVNMRGKLPANFDYDFGGDYNGVSGDQEILTKTEVVNLAIVPSVTQDAHNSVVHTHKGNVHSRRHRPFRFEDLSNIHCAMQFVVGVAALACIFGMVGAYFRNRFLDTQVPTYRL